MGGWGWGDHNRADVYANTHVALDRFYCNQKTNVITSVRREWVGGGWGWGDRNRADVYANTHA